MRKLFCSSRVAALALLFSVAVSANAYPWPGLAHAYPTGSGCVFLLIEMTQPNGDKQGRVAFTHNPVDQNSGVMYMFEFDEDDRGQYGFNGTGINYASGSAWNEWSVFWQPWGNWW